MLSCGPRAYRAFIVTVHNLWHFYEGQFTCISFKIQWISVVFYLQDDGLLSDILPTCLVIFLYFSVLCIF